MDDTGKYLIQATITADGVVERSDVVGAVYGQTEGLLGDELDLRYLQRASKVGRLDVEIESEGGQSAGTLEIGSGLDRPETAILAAALETIDQIGPCSATVEVVGIEDVRTAERRKVADRAKELLESGFQDGLDPGDVVAEVRESARTGEITTYEGLPAGPRVATGDAIIVVEGRADVRRLLSFGIKNAIAVEGTDVPDAVAALSRDRTTTALLDGDRGGDLLLRELRQVAAIDHVAFIPEDRSVEDLERHEVFEALREKVPVDALADPTPADDVEATDPATVDADAAEAADPATSDADAAGAADPASEGETPEDADSMLGGIDTDRETDAGDADAGADGAGPGGGDAEPETLGEHVAAARDAGTVRLLDADHALLSEAPVEDAVDAIEAADPVPTTVVLDGTLTQRLLDVAAQRGVGQVIARETGEFAKQPADVRVRLAEEFELADA
ncbi:MAG: DNA primase DnaG [Halobacteriales archaeon]